MDPRIRRFTVPLRRYGSCCLVLLLMTVWSNFGLSTMSTDVPIWYDSNKLHSKYNACLAGIESKFAIVTMLSSPEYILGAMSLGVSIRNGVSEEDYSMILLLLDERYHPNSKDSDILKKIGWVICEIQRIPPPQEEKVYYRFRDQFTKFSLWTWTSFKRVVYLDSDCLVTGNIDDLLRIGAPFGAVRDFENGGFVDHFNMGVFSLLPNISKFLYFMEMRESFSNYRLDTAEQGLLYGIKEPWFEIDPSFNANLAIYFQNRTLWTMMVPDIRIVHYTMDKPFLQDLYDVHQECTLDQPVEFWWCFIAKHELLQNYVSLR